MGTQMTFGAAGADWPTLALGACAVIAAILVPYFQRRAQIRDERTQQTALATVMRGALRQPVETFGHRCRVLAESMKDQSWRTSRPPKTLFLRPPEFDQFRPHLHLLGDAGTLVNDLISDQNDAWVIVKALRADDRLSDEWLSNNVKWLEAMADRAERCAEMVRTGPDH